MNATGQNYLVIVVKPNGKKEWKSLFSTSEEAAKATALSQVYASARDYAAKGGAWRNQIGWNNMDDYQRATLAKGYKVEHVVIEA